ncbi:MAG: DUF433 domain-containing protein [Ardenticatenales bacterium]|jgi:uncharacterized protein (DUF433 family)|nr:DUF433 domain-containing protein [Ardenticatenales bacterium]
MDDRELVERITVDPRVLAGKPVIKGTRLAVEYILKRLAHGSSVADILAEYEGIHADDVLACLLFASRALEDTTYMPLVTETA